MKGWGTQRRKCEQEHMITFEALALATAIDKSSHEKDK